MKTRKLHKMVQSIFGVLALCMLVALPAAFADYIEMEYVNADGQVEPAVLTRCNNNGYAVGRAGRSTLDFFTVIGLLNQELGSMAGLVCTDLDSPVASTFALSPSQIQIGGNTYPLGETPFTLSNGMTIADYVFIPFDINDDNTIVGGLLYVLDSGMVSVCPFIAEAPWTLATIILSATDQGAPVQPVVPDGSVTASFVTGINNSGDIVGVLAGSFASDNFLSIGEGFAFNKTALESDGLLSVDEISTFNCSGSLLTVPMSINNAGNVTGYALSLKYPLSEGSYVLDLDDNYMLSDNDIRIPAGADSDPLENILKSKYVEIKGFVKAKNAADNDFIIVSHVTSQAMAADQDAGEVEVYGTIPYTILDSDRVLFFFTDVDPDNGREDELFTLNELLAALMYPDQYSAQVNAASLLMGQSSPPNHDMALAQGYGFPGATVSGLGDINTSGTAVGGCVQDGVLQPYIYTPGVCVEENDGYIDIMGRPSCVTTDTAPLYVPVRVQATPNAVYALGFEVVYDSNVLEFVGFVTDPTENELPTTLLAGWQADGQASWDVDEVGLGLIRVGAYTLDSPILENTEGILGYLVFNSFSAEVTGLQIQGLVDDIAAWTATGACLSQATGDCNDDGVVTPADALCAFEKALGMNDTSCGSALEVPSDVEQDGDFDMYDVLCIFKYYLGVPSCLGSGEAPLVF